MNYDQFKKLKPSEKWFYVWESLDNHLSQIKEIKWFVRITMGSMISGTIALIYKIVVQ